MTLLQSQGVHHITLVGSNRDSVVDFYEGVLGLEVAMDLGWVLTFAAPGNPISHA